jgi:hypothetical protein
MIRLEAGLARRAINIYVDQLAFLSQLGLVPEPEVAQA